MRKFHSLRVADLQPDAEDAVILGLEVPPELKPEYIGLPGQHVVLRTELDGQEARRTYSLINAPGEWPLRIAARIHENGRMSRFLAQQLKVGDAIDVLPPNGSLTPRLPHGMPAGSTPSRSGPTGSAPVGSARPDSRTAEDSGSVARTYVGFAAGCGITPILSIARTVLQSSARDRFILFYGNTDTGRVMCLEALLGLKDSYLERLALHFLMSQEPQEVELYNGRLDARRVKQLAPTLFEPAQVTEFFLCGPGDMIEQVTGALRELSVAADRIHGEHFTTAGIESAAGIDAPREVDSPPAAVAPAAADSAEVTVLIDGRRRTFAMRMNDATILDAATRAGLELPYSCRAGVCSTCRTKVISGEVEMEQNYALEDWELEQGYVLACQSRVKTPILELDYDEK